MRSRPLPRTFSSGELAPWVDGITNELTQKGCRTLENFIVKKQGQATRRPGTYFVKEVKTSANLTMLVPVVIDDSNRFILEVGDAYIRVYNQTTHAYNSTEIVSPWSTAELATLAWKYISDEKAIYWVQAAHQEQKLVYASGTSWTLSAVTLLQSHPPIAAAFWGRTALSYDARTWKEGHVGGMSAGGDSISDLVWGREVLIGVNGASIFISADEGTTWIKNAVWTSNGGRAAFSTGRDIVVVGDNASGSSGTLAVSNDDGTTWTERTGLTNNVLYAVGYEPTTDSWMAVGTTSRCYFYGSEPNAITSVTEAGNLYGVWGDSTLWVAIGSGTVKYAASVTAAFTSVTMTGTLYGVTKGSPGNVDLWVAVGTTAGGNAVIYSSPTGTVWTQRYNSATYAGSFIDVKWVGNQYIAVGQTLISGSNPRQPVGSTGTIFAQSADGITWTVDTTLSRNPTTGWVITAYRKEANITDMNATGNLPYCIESNEGRMVLVNSSEPATVYGSRTGVLNNFFLGQTAEKAFSYKLAGNNNTDIQWMMGGMGGLVVGTRTGEGILVGSPDEGITPLTAQFRWLSTFGSSNVQPVRVHDTIVFVQRGGEIIRGYVPAANAYQSPDLTAYADHIGDGGITELDHQDDPQSMVYALRSDGQLPVLTFDNGMRAWSRIKAAASAAGAAVIESVAVIPTTGAEDEVWLIVKRTVGGSTKRYIEYMDTLAVASYAASHYLDCGVYSTSGTSFQTVGALTHLAGENVDALISGPSANIRWISGLTVAASGTITTAPYSGTSIHVGLPYTSYLQTLRGDYGSNYGDGAGLTKYTSRVTLWVSDSSATAKFGPTTTTATERLTNMYSSSVALCTEVITYPFPGQSDRDNYIWCIVDDPRPFTLVALLPDTQTADY